jgi:hypothetical protein
MNMARTELDRLIDQLYEREDDPRAQKAIIRQLVQLGDPEAIVELSTIYNKQDADPGVKRAAADALRVFWRMEQRIRAGKKRGVRRQLPVGLLKRLRFVLAALFILTLLSNVILVVVRSLPPPPTPVQTVPSSRDTLFQTLSQRIVDAQKDEVNLRLRWQELQVHAKLTCPGQFNAPTNYVAAGIDLTTYPLLQKPTDELNAAIQKLADLRARWANVCVKPNDPTAADQAAGDGGASARIADVDTASTMLDSAQLDLTKFKNAPTPTNTLTPSATPTRPTNTPTRTPTPGPTHTASNTPTNTPTPTVTPLQILTFDGLHLNTLTSYAYTFSVTYNGLAATGGTFTGTLSVEALRPVTLDPQGQAQYEISLSEDLRSIAGLNGLFKPGRVRYEIRNGTYYVNTLIPPSVACRASAATAALTGALDSIRPDDLLKPLASVTLNRVQPDESINGVTAQHYHADAQAGAGRDLIRANYDLYVTADKHLPVRAAYAVTGPYAGLPNVPQTDALTSYNVQYDLTQINPTVKLDVPLGCPAA